jgi:hypothetical protein
LVYILVGGPLLLLLLWLAVLSRRLTVTTRRLSEQEYQDAVHDFGPVREGHRPVPLFLVVLIVLFVAWAIGYTFYSVEHFPY